MYLSACDAFHRNDCSYFHLSTWCCPSSLGFSSDRRASLHWHPKCLSYHLPDGTKDGKQDSLRKVLWCLYYCLFFFKEGGISGFYRGLIPTIIGMAPYAGYYHTINIRIFWCSRFNNTSADVILFIFSILQDFLSSPSVLWRLRDSLTFQSS